MKPSRKNKWDDDYYTRLARQKGYPARSVFKLEELQKKFSLIKKGDIVLDIGAAPGSWSLYVSRLLGDRGKITGVDTQPMDNSVRLSTPFYFIRGDIFESGVFQSIVGEGPYDVILSDAAPSTTGNRLVDSARSKDLAARVLETADQCLCKGGNLVLKIFQGEDSGDILIQMNKFFRRVKAYKPATSRKKSTEQYYVGCHFI
jgi:23S rRNA (uridine2552-2'-O)-methyltransferase